MSYLQATVYIVLFINSPKQKIVKFHTQKQTGRSHVIDIFTSEDMENISLCIFQYLTLYHIINPHNKRLKYFYNERLISILFLIFFVQEKGDKQFQFPQTCWTFAGLTHKLPQTVKLKKIINKG
jgi:hypothetical protein